MVMSMCKRKLCTSNSSKGIDAKICPLASDATPKQAELCTSNSSKGIDAKIWPLASDATPKQAATYV
jgi:hypothetical protein